MGWLFRKSFKIFPGIRINLGKKGFTSLTIGKGPFSTNLNSKGIRHSVSIPKTGLSYRTKRRSFLPSGNSSGDTGLVSQVWECSQCHILNPEQAKFCDNCGAHSALAATYLTAAPDPPIQYTPAGQGASNSASGAWMALAVIGIVLFGLCGLSVLFIPRQNSTPVSNVRSIEKPPSTPEPTPAPIVTLKGKAGNKKRGKVSPTATPANEPPSGIYSFSQPAPRPTAPASRRSRGSYSSGSRSGYIRGPRGGCYYINGNGNKTYVDRSLCN